MSNLAYKKPQLISLKNDPSFNEQWVQQRIAEDPGLLGLGDIVLKDKERTHPSGGRLDLLCQDVDTNRRFEIEIQLGRTDESHIIRTLEYWDLERKRYPQYDHTAVLVAENITSRFLNVISLFNGAIPLIAIQMQAFQVGESISLVFTTVLSEMRLGLVDEDEEVAEVTDRAFWEKQASKSSLELVDSLLPIIHEFAPELSLKYNKLYIGLARDGQARNFVIFRPKKEWIRIEVRLEKSAELQAKMEEAGLDVLGYDAQWGRYRIRLTKADAKKHESLLRELMKQAHGEASA